jgi:hypothetical protein
MGIAVFVGAASGWAEQGDEHGGHDQGTHDHGASATAQQATTGSQEQTLTGEVVDVFCYLSHTKDGIGKGHAECAKKCIKSGLPVALKVGDQLYLVTMADHNPANHQLADLAAEQVTVRGKVMEQDGQRLIAISDVQKAHQ